MPLPRLLFFVVGLSVILGMMLWLVTSIYQLYIEIQFTSPLLANILIFFLLVLLVVLITCFVYYFISFFQETNSKKRRRKLPNVRLEKTEAVSKTLNVVKEQVKQIQDKVAQEALLNRSKAIKSNLSRGQLRIVAFGTGSAGKTSLINAMIGQIVGKVEPTMGTTEVGKTYSLQLKGVSREIWITDTPGILEAGVAGTHREQLAAQLATEADLLLFVVDNDLQQSEYQPLQNLAKIGKRSLLVFNKIDLYPEKELTEIMAQLRERVKNIIHPNDVIAIAAHPGSVRLPTGEIVHPEPEIMPLIKRLAAVLRAEGEELIADNILLQSQRLGEETRQLLDQQKRKQADKIIDRYQWIGAGVIAVTPLPVVDMLATAAVNAQMVIEIGQVYGCELNPSRGRELALSLGKTLISLGVVKGSVEILAKALQFTIATYLVGKVIQGVTAAYLTRIAGKSFIEYFRQDQDWGDGGITEVVQRQFQLSKKDEFVKAFVKDAIAKVVEPLTDNNIDDDEEEDNDNYFDPHDDWETTPRRNDSDEW